MVLQWYIHVEEVIARVVVTVCVCAILALFACFVWKCPAIDVGKRTALLAIKKKKHSKRGGKTYERVGEEDATVADIEQVW